MTYIVSASLRMEPDDFWQSNRMQRLPARKFHKLSAAKQYADRLSEKLTDGGLIIEVTERSGPAEYRLERDGNGKIHPMPLV
jgi:hypothetical protein